MYFIKTLLAILINFIIYKYALYKTSDLRINIVSSYFANFNNLYYQNNNETINSINNYCEDFYQIFFLVHRLLSDLILAIALFIYLSLINVYIFIFFILSAILFIFSYNKLIKLNVRFGFNVNESRYSITKELRDTFSIKKEIYIYGKIQIFLDFIKKSSELIAKNQTIIKLISSSPRLVLELIFILCILTSLVISINNFEIDYFLIGIVFLITIKIIPVAQQFLNFLSSLNSTTDSLDRIKLLLQSSNNHFDNIDKTYSDHKFKISMDRIVLLKNKTSFLKTKIISLKSGDHYFLSGSTGSGKTTLIEKIISIRESKFKFYIFEKNKFISISNIKNYCSYVPQSSQIINNSIIFNITLTKNIKKIDQKCLNEALDICDIKPLFKKFKNGINENIGEKGKKLSGGEIQRICIARALYFKRNILILDESTSGLNQKLETKILKKIKLIYKQKIIILISHNKNLKKYCNKEIRIY